MASPERLRELPCFKWASQDSLKTLSMVTEEVSFEDGREVFRKGDDADFLYVLTEGEVDVELPLASGDRRVVDRLGPGDLMLWSAVVEPYVSTAFGVARGGCRAIAVDAARLRQLMREDGELYHSLMTALVQVVASRLTGARRRLAELG